MKKNRTIMQLEKLQDNLAELKVKCSCGHVKTMPVFLDSTICNQCGNKIKNNTKAYFIYKLRKELKKNEKDTNC